MSEDLKNLLALAALFGFYALVFTAFALVR